MDNQEKNAYINFAIALGLSTLAFIVYIWMAVYIFILASTAAGFFFIMIGFMFWFSGLSLGYRSAEGKKYLNKE